MCSSYSCCVFRRRTTQLEEGEVGTLQPVFARVTQRWMEFMVQTGETSAPSPPQPIHLPPHPHMHTHPNQDSFARIQVAPPCPRAPPTWCPASSFRPSCLSSPLWSPQWLETPVSASLSSFCEFGVSQRLSKGCWGPRFRRRWLEMRPWMVCLLSIPPSQQDFTARRLHSLLPWTPGPHTPPCS